jgi:PBSX family phage portal protein
MDNCSFFDACVRQIAKDVVGQGWSLAPRQEAKEGEKTAEDEAARKEIEEFLEDPNTEEESISDVIEKCVVDWGCVGWFGMEVSRDDGGRIDGIYHVPAYQIRVHKDKQKFCQFAQSTYRWFKRFGYEKDIDTFTGEETDIKDKAHEMVFYANYYPQSAWYGSPMVLSAVGAVKALIGIRDYNLAFFENYGIPAALVTIEGVWDEDAVKEICAFIDVEIKGSSNAHKTIVLNPPQGGKVTWEPLVVEVKEGHFKLYHKSLRDEVLVAYKMPPYRIGIAEAGSLGGSTALESTRIYIDSVVEPLKVIVEHIFSQKIIRDGFDCELYLFDLGELDIRDETVEIDNCLKLVGIAAMSPNDVLRYLGREALDEEKCPWAGEYFMRSDLVPAGQESLAARDMGFREIREEIEKLTREAASGGLKTLAAVKELGEKTES